MTGELVPGVHHLDLGFVSAYLLEDGDDLVLCDAGTPWSADGVRAGLAAAGFAVEDVDRVLLTHYDLDHVGGLAPLGLEAPVYAGHEDAALLRGDARPPLSNHKGLLQRAMGPFVGRPAGPVRPVADGEALGSFTAYRTPGHTPGHVAYVSEPLDVALLGDLVVERRGALRPSPWFLSYDTARVRASLRGLADRELSVGAVGVGHGDPLTTGGAAALARAAGRA